MGEAKVSKFSDKAMMKNFVRSLLNDVEALQYMLEHDWIEDDVIRIGAEQEICIVDRETLKPRPIAMEVLHSLGEQDWLETELATFNLETGLKPRIFETDCLRKMEEENEKTIQKLTEVLREFDAAPLLTGIMPTLRRHHMSLKYLTPFKRYKALMDVLAEHRMGKPYDLRLNGIDELNLKHDSAFFEACNTSFQVHLQVRPHDFVNMYNIAQLIAAPIISLASNSSVVFGRRLWHESRIALFQQSIDTRTAHEHLRERLPRVTFGNHWLRESILEIYKEDIARFRVLLSADVEENSMEKIAENIVPNLHALQVHNGTIYRWNRPCYGVGDTGKPHLRIENRVLGAGPTVKDEMANATVWLGAMVGFQDIHENISDFMTFSKVVDNFGKAAKYGLETKFNWKGNKIVSASEVILNEILPMAEHGLKLRNINPSDIDEYLGIVKERVHSGQNGATWVLSNFSSLIKTIPRDEAVSVITSSMLKNQEAGMPVHLWNDAKVEDLGEYHMKGLKVEEFMNTDIFSVHQNDIVELVAEMMDWNMFRYVPVENMSGELVGLVTGRLLLRHYIKLYKTKSDQTFYVQDIMIKDPITITPEQTVLEALRLMRDNRIGCLPVIQDKDLVGIITEHNFLRVTGRLLDRFDAEE